MERDYEDDKIEAIYERMEMFKEVLETEDAEDLIANYGMGKGLFDLEKYEESIPYLKKAIEIKKDYSTAYLYLGKSLEFNNKKEEALDIYKIGINEASKKGDLMPLKEMEKRKSNLVL
ncbi:MAG: tetratricopeptide repeat protein [Cyanobacteriota bacterium]